MKEFCVCCHHHVVSLLTHQDVMQFDDGEFFKTCAASGRVPGWAELKMDQGIQPTRLTWSSIDGKYVKEGG